MVTLEETQTINYWNFMDTRRQSVLSNTKWRPTKRQNEPSFICNWLCFILFGTHNCVIRSTWIPLRRNTKNTEHRTTLPEGDNCRSQSNSEEGDEWHTWCASWVVTDGDMCWGQREDQLPYPGKQKNRHQWNWIWNKRQFRKKQHKIGLGLRLNKNYVTRGNRKCMGLRNTCLKSQGLRR
jgi:hypothetical protein